jgi:hypothetical protein
VGNAETPGPGLQVCVGGPPLEILSAGAEDSLYVNGTDVAHFVVQTQSNAGVAESLAVHVTLASNLGDQFEGGIDTFGLAAHARHTSQFAWPVPAANHPWEFTLTATLSRGGVPLQAVTRSAAFTGMVQTHPELAQSLGLLVEPTGCLAADGACVASTAGAVPHFGTLANFSANLPRLCQVRNELLAGNLVPAGTYGLAALLGATEIVLESLPVAATVGKALPVAVASTIECHESLVSQGMEGTPLDPAAKVDLLATTVRAVFAAAGRQYSNEVLALGPSQLRVGRDGQYTSSTNLGLRDAFVFDVGSTRIQWAHVGREPRLLGSSGANPHAAFDLELRGNSPGSLELGVLHRTAADSILWLRYAPIAVTSKSILRAHFHDDLLYPWGYALYLDTQGDGRPDDILYPAGFVLSGTAPPNPGRFQLFPVSPNPFNPATTIRYALPGAGPVTVTLLDVRGRAVCTLHEGVQPPGLQELRWNGTLAGGGRLASGVYFVRVTSPWGTAAQKLTIVK